MKKLTIATLTILTLILTACGSASSSTPQAGPGSQGGTLPAATQLIVGIFKLEDTDQAITADQARQLLPLWQVYQDLLISDTAAQEEINALVEQTQEMLTADQTQVIAAMNLTQQDVFALIQEKGMGMTRQNNSGGGNGAGNGNNFGGGGFVPPDGGMMPVDGPPDGGGFPGGGQPQTGAENGTDSASRPAQLNPGSILLDPLIELLKGKIGTN